MKLVRKHKYLLTIVLITILLLATLYIKNKLNKQKYDIEPSNIEIVSTEEIKTNDKNTIQNCIVDIKGAIINPGVYSTDCESYVQDIIELAGGLTNDADTSVINLAKKISNEMVIIIYTKEEVKNSNIVDTVIKVVEKECTCPNIQNDGCINNEINEEITNSQSLININTSTLEELKTIPGIGEAKAKSIIKYREEIGPFETIEDIKNVEGIGSKLYEEIKIYITT